MKKELVYDDISLFSRQISTIKSRFSDEIKLSNQVKFGNQIVDMGILMSAPMLDVSGEDLCVFLNNRGHLGVLHRFMSPHEQNETLVEIMTKVENLASFSIGINDFEEKLEQFKETFSEFSNHNFLICIDTANGASTLLEKPIAAIKKLAEEMPQNNFEILAGNIVTKEAAEWLYDQGVRFARVGIGGGSVCTTPLATGIFRPIVSAIMEIDQWRIDSGIDDFYIVADGGIKGAADVMKAIAVGADFVMLGSLFAGWDKSASPLIEELEWPLINQATTTKPEKKIKLYKHYRGMASAAMAELNNKVNNIEKKIIPEGVSSLIPYKGEIEPWFEQFIGSLKSSMSYAHARTIQEFKNNIEVVEITGAGNNLRQPHQLNK